MVYLAEYSIWSVLREKVYRSKIADVDKLKQESCAIAKMTAQCALYTPAVKNLRDSLTGSCLPEILDCSFQWGLRTPNFGEGEAVGGQGWYRSKER